MPLKTDIERAEFLTALDDSLHINPNNFEIDFLGSNLDKNEFSPKQRDVIDNMEKKYGTKVKYKTKPDAKVTAQLGESETEEDSDEGEPEDDEES